MADTEGNCGSAEPYSGTAATSKQACACADRKQGDTTRSDANAIAMLPVKNKKPMMGKIAPIAKRQKEEPAAPQAEPPRSSGSIPSRAQYPCFADQLMSIGIAIVVLALIVRRSDFSGWQSATNTVLGVFLLVVTLINWGVPVSPLVTFWIDLWVGLTVALSRAELCTQHR